MSDSVTKAKLDAGTEEALAAGPVGWLDGCHIAGSALAVIGLFQALAAALSQVLSLRSSAGLGGVGQVQLSGFYGLTMLAAVLLLAVPSAAPRMTSQVRGRFLAVAATAIAFIAAIQLVEVYTWLTSTTLPFYQRALGALVVLGDLAITGVAGWVCGHGSRRAAREAGSAVGPYLAAGIVFGCVCAILIQLGTTVGLSSPSPQAPNVPSAQVSTVND